MKRASKFVLRWQEYVTWMPATIILAIAAWILLGGLDRTAGQDALPMIIALPIKVAYVFAALGATYLVRKRWRMKLDPLQQLEYWNALRAGERGAIVIFVVDALFTLCALYWLLLFFNLPS